MSLNFCNREKYTAPSTWRLWSVCEQRNRKDTKRILLIAMFESWEGLLVYYYQMIWKVRNEQGLFFCSNSLYVCSLCMFDNIGREEEGGLRFTDLLFDRRKLTTFFSHDPVGKQLLILHDWINVGSGTQFWKT